MTAHTNEKCHKNFKKSERWKNPVKLITEQHNLQCVEIAGLNERKKRFVRFRLRWLLFFLVVVAVSFLFDDHH